MVYEAPYSIGRFSSQVYCMKNIYIYIYMNIICIFTPGDRPAMTFHLASPSRAMFPSGVLLLSPLLLLVLLLFSLPTNETKKKQIAITIEFSLG